MKSIQYRLSLGLVLVSLIFIVILWVGHGIFLRHLAKEFVGMRLSRDAAYLIDSLQPRDGRLILPTGAVSPDYFEPTSHHYFRLQAGAHEYASNADWFKGVAPPADDTAATLFVAESPDGTLLLVYRQRLDKFGQPVIVSVAEDFSEITHALVQLHWTFALVGLLFLVLLLTIHQMVVRRSLAPLAGVRLQLQALQQGRHSRLDEQVPTEIAALVHEINFLVDTMEQRIERSRNALGNLSHALKTPLATLHRLLEQQAERLPSASSRQLSEQIQRIHTLIERELKRARIAGAIVPGSQVELMPEVEKITAMLHTIYRDKSIDFRYQGNAAQLFPGDRNDLMELLGNLLDNAFKWAHGAVLLTVSRDEAYLTLCLEDDGPGVSASEIEHLSQRGVRIDEQISGHGLGLAIVKDIVEMYQGELAFAPSERLGGFAVTVRLPSRPQRRLDTRR